MAKKNYVFISFVFLMISNFAFSDLPRRYSWKTSNFVVAAEAPPAVFYVVDSQGRRTGADPNLPINQNGQQGANVTSGLSEIPLSLVVQENIASDDKTTQNQPQANTLWDAEIYDGGAQTYTINVTGLTAGDEKIYISGFLKHQKGGVRNSFEMLVLPGKSRQITVAFDLAQKSIVTTPVVNNGDLLDDIESACEQRLISRDVCDFLKDKADRIKKALDRHRLEKTKPLIESFLCNLGERRGDGDDDRDDHDAVKEPALSILKTDAETLLAQVERSEQAHHDDSDHDGDDHKNGH